jgi:AcrR family transcriptional regulator
MGKKAGLTREDVVGAAALVADRDGFEQLSIARVAEVLGIQSPSLYHHVDGLDELRHEVAVLGSRELAGRFARSLQEAGEVDAYENLRIMARAFRDFAREHPGLYAAAQPATSLDADLTLYQAAPEAFDTVLRTVASLGLPDEEQVSVIRSVRAALHGFIICETRPGFGTADDVDASFDHMIDILDAGLRVIVERHRRTRPS